MDSPDVRHSDFAVGESSDYRRYLDPKVLAKISGLELRARLIVEGLMSGMHRSPHRGLSIEFADHRAYTQGDDLRHIDWKVFGRTDKYYIKQYEQETNLNLMLAVDCSESMTYRDAASPMSKHEYAVSASAAIAYLALMQHDAAGIALFDERLTHFVRCSNRAQHWKTLVQEMAGRTGPGKTSLASVLHELADRLSQSTVIIVISDLFDEPDAILKGLSELRFRRHEVIVWNIWDRAERTFPFESLTRFEGLEATGALLAEPGALRGRYLEEVERFLGRLRRGCGRIGVDFSVFDTSDPMDAALSGYLVTRSARLRQRSSRVLGRG